MENRMKALTYNLLHSLKRERDERKFEADIDQMKARMDVRFDEIMMNFRSNLIKETINKRTKPY